MARYYLDTRTVLKRYLVAEQGSAWIRQLCAPGAGHALLVSGVTEVEVASALARLLRAGPVGLKEAQRRALIGLYRRHVRRREYVPILIGPDIVRHAADLCRTRALRAYDALRFVLARPLYDCYNACGWVSLWTLAKVLRPSSTAAR